MAGASVPPNKDVILYDDEERGMMEIDFTKKDAMKNFLRERNAGIVNCSPAGDVTVEVQPLLMREYQKELAFPSLTGENTIICAPTGSGKTIVAVFIIREHLRTMRKNGLPGKVVMFVPTVNLIDQQVAVLERYLKNEFRIIGIKGGQTTTGQGPKPMLLHDNDISVMTPQLFLNMLICRQVDANQNGFDFEPSLETKITDVSLIVFDECHHCDKSHSYNEIMINYFDTKEKMKATGAATREKLPQIVGLTASLGVGQADDIYQAMDHIVKISANLDARNLSIIEKYMAELEQFVYAPKDEMMSVRCPHYDHPLSKNIIALMTIVEKLLTPIFDHLVAIDSKKVQQIGIKPPENRWLPHYTNWVYNWYHHAPLLENAVMKREFTTLLEHLIVYHLSLEINALAPTKFAVDFLSDEFEIIIRKKKTDLDNKLIGWYLSQREKFNLIANQHQIKNPIVEKLREILINEYRLKPDSRTLIFVRTRELALAVEKFINTDPELRFLNAGHLTGLNARRESGGQTMVEQQETLARFRDGTQKVLVVTTVAEEGLDVNKCNLVIKYNHVTNEIAMVQRRGRGRAEGSKSILLTHENWIENKEMVNLIREKLMKMAIIMIKTKGERWFIESVQKRAEQSKNEREIAKMSQEKARKALGNKTYELRCKKCENLMSESTHVRRIQDAHYVIVDPEVWSRLTGEPKNLPLLYETISVAGNLSCKSCRNECGIVIRYQQVYLPAIRAESMVLYFAEKKERKVAKKWKQIVAGFFVVDPLHHSELLPMNFALDENSRQKLDFAVQTAELEKQVDEAEKENAIETGADLFTPLICIDD